MRKLLAFALSLCMVASMLCITVFAEDIPSEEVPPAAGTVIRVSGLKADGAKTEIVQEYTNHAVGWEAAIDLARSSKEMKAKGFIRVVVDLYADWTAVKGEFCNSGDGFNWDAIYFPADVRVTVNMNGHTIDRGIRDAYQYNGEVMYIDENADVIINNGTITGGYSCNGAGGIHINDDAKVTLNNVNVERNKVQDDDGGGIALYDGATLIMNGGSISNNDITRTDAFGAAGPMYGGGIYAEDSTVVLKSVTIANNYCADNGTYGSAIGARESSVSMERCSVFDNDLGMKNAKGKIWTSPFLICTEDSTLTIKSTTFRHNGGRGKNGSWSAAISFEPYAVLGLYDSELVMSDGCKFTDNIYTYAIALYNTKITISDTDFTGNKSMAIYESDDIAYGSTVSRCKFSRGTPTEYYKDTFQFNGNSNIQFTECDFGDATALGFDLGSIALLQGEATEGETTPAETPESEPTEGETTPAEAPESEPIEGETTPAEAPESEPIEGETIPSEAAPVETTEDETTPPETVELETINTEISFLENPEGLIIPPEDATPSKVGSMVGNGSLSMLISLAALAVSVVCLGFTFTIYKKISVKSEDNK